MGRRRHWWNGRWGRLARRDVLLFEDGGLWRLEARQRGVEGSIRSWEFSDEEAATAHARALRDGDGWRELDSGRNPPL
ncbi:hypothetical protein AB0M79_28345 [Polymorphospora sp. NPDC051019]|uniref:hypothetical protein n=1 Tax=Polymorphospora sp. NPDC051019 TaxID=3155725 RepID=UPI00343C37F9